MKQMKLLRNIILYSVSFLFIVLFLPGIFGDSIGIPKLLVLVAGNASLLLLWSYDVYRMGSLRWIGTPFNVPLLVFMLAYLAGAVFASSNTIGSLLSPVGAGEMLMLVLFYILVVQTRGIVTDKGHTVSEENTAKLPIAKFIAMVRRSEHSLINGLLHGSLVVAVWNLVNVAMQLVGFSRLVVIGQITLQFPLSQLSPVGDIMSQTVFLLIMLAYVLFNLSNRTIFGYIKLGILLLGLIGSGYVLSQTSPFPLLPYRFGWAIAIETFKNAPFFGVGPENFVSAFTRYKSADINLTPYWNASFGLSSNMYFHLLTTVGVLGLGSYLLLIRRVYVLFKTANNVSKGILRIILGMFLIQIVIPFGMPLLFVLFVLLLEYAVKSNSQATKIEFVKIPDTSDSNIYEYI